MVSDCLGVQRSDLAVGAEVRCRDLEGDLIVGQFAHLLGQKVGLSHQRVGFHHLLPESREALTEQLIPDTHTHRTQGSFNQEDLSPVLYFNERRVLFYRSGMCKQKG